MMESDLLTDTPSGIGDAMRCERKVLIGRWMNNAFIERLGKSVK